MTNCPGGRGEFAGRQAGWLSPFSTGEMKCSATYPVQGER